MGMKWIKQIFGIKDDTVELDDKFTNASATSELVVKPRVEQSNSDMQTTASLNKMTKTQIDELAKNALGVELDRRKKKDTIIEDYLSAQSEVK